MKSIAVGVFASVRRNIFTLLMLGLLGACGGGTPPDDTTYGISGTVSGASGVTVTLSGDGSATTTTDGSGNYSFTGLANGAYTVTPSLAGYTFSPVSRAITLSGADSTGNDFVSSFGVSSISGTVAGTEIVAVDDSGAIVASDDTTGKTQNTDGSYSFTLTGIPINTNIRVYLITESGVYPLYFGAPSTNVFSLSAVAAIDLGFVNTTSGQAIPENDPTAITEFSQQAENTDTLVHVTDESTGVPLSGVTVIIDHASDPRQIATTTTAGSASFTPPSSGPVTITIGMSGYEIATLVNFNLVYLDIPLGDLNQLAFVQGTASNFTTGLGTVTPAFLGTGDWWDGCPFPTCEDLDEGTIGFYKKGIELPNRQYALSAFEQDATSTPINFTAATGIGPLTDGQTLTVDLTFPTTAPATTTTTGTITVPASLGAIVEVSAVGTRDLGDQGELILGGSAPGTGSPYSYTALTFAFSQGTSDDIIAIAIGTTGGETSSIQRGVGFGGSGVDFTLIDIPINLSPIGSCGGVAPTLSWTAVPGASFYVVGLEGIPSDWEIIIDGGSSTSIALPDLTGTPIAALGLSSLVPVNWFVQAIVAPGYSFNTISEDIARKTMTDRSVSAEVICTPP